jgi:hypothetical protein
MSAPTLSRRSNPAFDALPDGTLDTVLADTDLLTFREPGSVPE